MNGFRLALVLVTTAASLCGVAIVRAQSSAAPPDCVHAWGPECEALLGEDEPAERRAGATRPIRAERRAGATPAGPVQEAQPEPERAAPMFGATAEIAAPITAMHAEDPTVSGTAISMRDRGYPGEELADVLPEVPGVRLMSIGGPGQPVGVRLRGGTNMQTTVLLGDLPISSPEAPFDLSLLPTFLIERVEIYRGDAPVWFGNGSIGGVLRVVPRQANGGEADARVSGASFGTYQVAGGASISTARASFVGAVGIAGTRGDFPFTDNNSTPLDPSDDFSARRQNADNLRGSVLLGGTLRLDAGTLETTLLLVGKDGGAIGSAPLPALRTHASDGQLWSATSFTREGVFDHSRAYRIQARLGVGVARKKFIDRYSEIGLGSGQVTDDRALTLDGRLAGSVELGEHAELVSVTSLQGFRRDPHDALAVLQVGSSSRLRFDQSAELRLHGDRRVRWELRPSARLTVSRGALRYHELNTFQTERAGTIGPTFRVGAVLAPRPVVAFRSAVHYGMRLPSMLELFGDRAGLLPSRGLRPERSLGVDVGTTLRREGDLGSVSVDVTGAVDRRYDLIQLSKTTQYTAIAENVGHAWVTTAELLGRATLTSHLRFDLQGTYLFSRTARGGTIPLQPALGAFGRFEGGTSRIGKLDDLAAYAEIMFVGANYADSANLERFDPRARVNVGLRVLLFARRLSASVEVVDVFDRAGFDLLGFPLPGRRYAAQVEYRKEL